MTVYDEIRDYFNGIVRTVDSDLKFDGFVFDTEKFGAQNLDNTYKLVIGAGSNERLDSSYLTTYDVQVWIYRSSGNAIVDDFDKTYCKAQDILALASDQTKLDQLGFMKSVLGINIEPQPQDSDDNSMRFVIQFEVQVFYNIEV